MNSTRRQVSWCRLTGLLLVGLFVYVSANERVLLDADWTLNYHHQAKSIAFNLTTPTVYSPGGKIHVRLYITSMNQPVYFQTCFYGCGSACMNETCADCILLSNKGTPFTQVYEPATLGTWWSNSSYSGPANTQIIDFVLKSTGCGSAVDPTAAQVPIVTHATVVAVTPGATFSGWSHYPIPGAASAEKNKANLVHGDNSPVRISRIGENRLSISTALNKPGMVQAADARGVNVFKQQLSQDSENCITLPRSASRIFIVKVFSEGKKACSQRIALVR